MHAKFFIITEGFTLPRHYRLQHFRCSIGYSAEAGRLVALATRLKLDVRDLLHLKAQLGFILKSFPLLTVGC